MLAKQIDVIPIEEAYEHLAKSIVIQAIEDYRKVLNNNKIDRYRKIQSDRSEIEHFFKSEWCHQLSGWDGEDILDIIREQEGVKNV